MKWFDLRVGGVLDVLPTLPDRSVNCCVTSPPYWGLRDYGTATWEGGDPACDHVQTALVCAKNATSTLKNDGRRKESTGHCDSEYKAYTQHYRDTCRKCGARRIDSQIGLEPTPEEYVAKMVAVFREVRRILRDDGTLWLNLGDSYNGMKHGSTQENVGAKRHNTSSFTKHLWDKLKPKDLVGIPWRVAFALQADGWYLRQDIIWSKPSPMPESVRDRCTKAHEYIFLLSKSGSTLVWRARDTGEWSKNPDLSETVPHKTLPNERVARWRGFDYYFDTEAIAEEASLAGEPQTFARPCRTARAFGKPSGSELHGNRVSRYETRNKRSVWTVTTKPFKEAHFATFPPDLIEPCILAGCPEGGVVMDPFIGSGTTAMVAIRNRRRCVGIELNPAYADMAIRRASGPVCDRESDLFETPDLGEIEASCG